MKHEDLTAEIISVAMRVHSILGPGLLGSAYRTCLKYELEKRGGLRVKWFYGAVEKKTGSWR